MCFHMQQTQSAKELQHRFKASFAKVDKYKAAIYNGFQFGEVPIITNENPGTIQLFHWGLIPSWAKDNSIRKNTLNARIETIAEKPAFKNSISNRCLVLIDGFYEWQWLDEKGKQKKRYLIHQPQHEAFALAGLWNNWVDKESGELQHTFTVLTTEANELMSKIHNTKKRMPIIVSKDNETKWLQGMTLIDGNNSLEAIET
jgi:putative SOS response-associated peptidase YedK